MYVYACRYSYGLGQDELNINCYSIIGSVSMNSGTYCLRERVINKAKNNKKVYKSGYFCFLFSCL